MNTIPYDINQDDIDHYFKEFVNTYKKNPEFILLPESFKTKLSEHIDSIQDLKVEWTNIPKSRYGWLGAMHDGKKQLVMMYD